MYKQFHNELSNELLTIEKKEEIIEIQHYDRKNTKYFLTLLTYEEIEKLKKEEYPIENTQVSVSLGFHKTKKILDGGKRNTFTLFAETSIQTIELSEDAYFFLMN